MFGAPWPASPEVDVNLTSSCGCDGAHRQGNCEKYKLKPSQRLTAYEGCFTVGMVSTVFYC